MIGLTSINLAAYIFIAFALTIPTIILYRIITKSLYDLYTIISRLVKQLGNFDNYKLSNIVISNLTLLAYICLPLFIGLWYLICILKSSLDFPNFIDGATNSIIKYRPDPVSDYCTAFSCYENISVAPNLFLEEINLNHNLGLTHAQLQIRQLLTVPIQTSTGEDHNLRVLYENEF